MKESTILNAKKRLEACATPEDIKKFFREAESVTAHKVYDKKKKRFVTQTVDVVIHSGEYHHLWYSSSGSHIYYSGNYSVRVSDLNVKGETTKLIKEVCDTL